MPSYQWKDEDRVSAKEAIAYFAEVKLTFPGRDRSMGVAR